MSSRFNFPPADDADSADSSLVKRRPRRYNDARLRQQRSRGILHREKAFPLKFILVDQLLSLEPGKRIVMAKNVSMAEEYLADHFPGFPVLPGVMMLEAAIQTAAWLVRHSENFAHSLIVLKEAKGVRYGTFVSPGQTLTLTADAFKISPTGSDFKIKGTVNGQTAITARLELAHLNLADSDPGFGKNDEIAKTAQQERWQVFQMNAIAPATS